MFFNFKMIPDMVQTYLPCMLAHLHHWFYINLLLLLIAKQNLWITLDFLVCYFSYIVFMPTIASSKSLALYYYFFCLVDIWLYSWGKAEMVAVRMGCHRKDENNGKNTLEFSYVKTKTRCSSIGHSWYPCIAKITLSYCRILFFMVAFIFLSQFFVLYFVTNSEHACYRVSRQASRIYASDFLML